MSQEPKIHFGKRLLTFLVTVVPWVYGGSAAYEIVRRISCSQLLSTRSSSYIGWCIYISYDFRPDLLFLAPVLLVLAFIFPVFILGQRPRLVLYSAVVISIAILCGVGLTAILNFISGADQF